MCELKWKNIWKVMDVDIWYRMHIYIGTFAKEIICLLTAVWLDQLLMK